MALCKHCYKKILHWPRKKKSNRKNNGKNTPKKGRKARPPFENEMETKGKRSEWNFDEKNHDDIE